MTDARLSQASAWIKNQETFSNCQITLLAGDASFRRYFRLTDGANSYVLMDAPPEKEDTTPFLRVSAWMQAAGLRTPQVLSQDQSLGFLILEDFGDETWSLYFQSGKAIKPLFKDALQQLHKLQTHAALPEFPLFNIKRMQTEINLYLDWYLPFVAKHTPTESERQTFHDALLPILTSIHALPKAGVHLDYHSRNLMVPSHGLPLGVIDFQDAVFGPITYDLASLLYDCYQDYDETIRRHWSENFFTQLPLEHKAYFSNDFNIWHQALRRTALQRHIKATGIFARLAYRDHKLQFLTEIPLTQKHMADELTALELQIPFINS
ncbi:MAG: hypothetical protein AUK35_07305 [Zetaproteobacteria bacterium CG2_30_46_52]|nr:MAG: hypothetical protein AUK35_07305 [Zetaproteobacteria bacterium CG2_30_46_52]